MKNHLAFTILLISLLLAGCGQRGAAPRNVFVYAFRRDDGRQFVAAWTKSAEQTIEISVTRPAKRAIEYGFDGSTAPYPAFAGRTLSHVALRPGTARLFELIP